MKRSINVFVSAVLMTVGLFVSSARAADEMPAGEHARGGLGFHNSSAPIGVRWWMSGEKIGIDAGVGFTSSPAPGYPKEKVSSYTLDFGVPLVMKSWSRAHLIFRPGLTYSSEKQVITTFPAAFNTDNQTAFSVAGEFEAEVFLVDNVSVSASHGVRFDSVNPVGPGDSITSFSTFGNHFTNIGFHVYFLGAK